MADPSQSSRPIAIDDLSKRIIGLLQEDGRRAYATIGREVGLSEAAVRQRVQRLTDAGIIQIVAVSDPLQVGLLRQAMVALTIEGPIRPITEALVALDEVSYVVEVAGRYDVLCEVVCVDDEALLDLVTCRIRSLPGVHRAEILVYLSLRKQTYRWKTE
ncbi:Lrp/AsnC family transcriptional regulator [Nocardia rhizosphaerihabitans]|uniref:Lrp/AsnC family transcriptional regulator n=1 Tax=Nocardia rhizosphaerihabitans TaxID=1691570 RepID=UPI00366FEE8E